MSEGGPVHAVLTSLPSATLDLQHVLDCNFRDSLKSQVFDSYLLTGSASRRGASESAKFLQIIILQLAWTLVGWLAVQDSAPLEHIISHDVL